jgi:hypothetical protein
MRCLSLVLVIVALSLPSLALAAGAYVRKDPEPVKASVVPLPSIPSVSASESFNGCGGRRVRDPKTGHCHGPGDLSH